MFESNFLIEEFWHVLCPKEKNWFLNNFKSQYMSYRVGMPKKNALKLLALLECNQVSLVEAKLLPKYDKINKKFIIQPDASTTVIKTDYLVNATGSPLKLEEIESSLISNLQKNGIIIPNEFGGIQVDFQTSKVINKQQAMFENLYAIGQITSGVYFFTSVLALNVKHAYQVALQISNDLQIN